MSIYKIYTLSLLAKSNKLRGLYRQTEFNALSNVVTLDKEVLSCNWLRDSLDKYFSFRVRACTT